MNRHPVLVEVAVVAALALLALPGSAAQQLAPERGLRRVDPRWHALVGATLIPAPGERVERATIVMRDGVIVSVAAEGPAPAGARLSDATGLFVYPGFIDAFVEVDAPAPDRDEAGAHWNPLITPQRSALDGDGVDADTRQALRALGFTAALAAPRGGIARGRAAVVALGEPADALQAEAADVLGRDVFGVVAFETAPFDWEARSEPRYPTSEMGAIAALRQALADADWHAEALAVAGRAAARVEPPQPAPALAALADRAVPLLFDTRDELQVLRADKVAREFGRTYALVGSGHELRRLDAIADLGRPMVVPPALPEKPAVATLAEAEQVSLRALMEWEQAPTNLRRLDAAGLEVSLTSSKLEKRGDFHANLRAAIRHGLDAQRALAMLTTHPARLVGLEGRLGRVAPGALAHLVVTDGELFGKETEVREVWVGGRRYLITPPDAPDAGGEWIAEFSRIGEHDAVGATLVVDAGKKKVTADVLGSSLEAREVSLGADRVSFVLDGTDLQAAPVLLASAVLAGDEMTGTLSSGDGRAWPFTARRRAPAADDAPAGGGEARPDEGAPGEAASDAGSAPAPAGEGDGGDADDEEAPVVPEEYGLPFGAFGLRGLPPQETVLVRGATIWTAGPGGVVENGDLLVKDGRVEYVGPRREGMEGRADRVVDAAGRHVTPGLIDCHSHTGVSGPVNEAGRRVTAEVRIADVIDPDDIDWYRQLAGGLTAANQLHGSANAIGGQNSVVKLRWGVGHPDGMRLQGAPPGIKFALGENPKRVAAGTGRPDEYPQSRMGVATLIRDRLAAARDDRAARLRHEALVEGERRRTLPPRRDLELEALGEVVAGERLVHCHSYRQDEILMLCRVAQEFGFRIGTFQHVLEGYKIAEAIRDAALGASTFSDWWAYKFEVIDAIPFNAALMTDVGVVVSINSDSADHARRLNTEAGKAIKYGGLDPGEALALVTLNPAIQLGVEDRVGSLEEGKDADFVIWSGPPLSYASRAEATWVDGREMFSLARHAELLAEARAERERLIGKLLARPAEGPDGVEDDETDEDAGRPDRAGARRPSVRGGPGDGPAPGRGECDRLDLGWAKGRR